MTTIQTSKLRDRKQHKNYTNLYPCFSLEMSEIVDLASKQFKKFLNKLKFQNINRNEIKLFIGRFLRETRPFYIPVII